MPPAPLPADEADRFATLLSLDLLDTPPEPVFDRIVKLTKRLVGADVAAISLLDDRRQWFKAICGLNIDSTPREQAFCGYTALGRNVLWVEDARLDPRFVDNPLVASGQVIFYAGAPLVAPNGQALGALCVFSDRPRAFDEPTAAFLSEGAALVMDAVAQRKARQESESQIARDMIRHAPTSISVLDRDLRFLLVSEKMEGETGVRESDVIGRPLFDLFPDMRAVEWMLRQALAGETLSGRRTPMRMHDGRVAVCDWQLAPWKAPDGRIVGVRVMTFDVTELVKSQRVARRSEERLKLAIDVAETVVWELDFKSGRVESVGESTRFFEEELNHADFVQDLLRTVHPEDRDRVNGVWRATIDHGRAFEVEYRLPRRNGDAFWVLSSAQVFKDRNGAPERIIGALRDVTARKQEALALDRAVRAAEAANCAKSEFLANMSHELRTPLNGVMGVAGALERTELSGHQREMVRLIETSAKTLEILLSDVLDLARIESGRLELREEAFSLSEVIGSVSALFAAQAQGKAVGFRLDQRARLEAHYLGDATRLRQVFANLLSNAVKFTHRGCVTFSIDRQLTDGGDHAFRFQVTDTGVGFDETARDRLFARFEQADGSITRQYGGTGLGLAISQSIIEAMGGRIEATSIPGSGSTFTFTVPFTPTAKAPPVEIAPPPPAGSVLRAPPAGLLAEDHPINRKVVALILESAEVDLITVVDGAEAVEAFRSQGPFDLILMDMQMPVMDGLTAIRAIRERERGSRSAPTPIYALTANAMPEHVESSLRAGADGHLSKPIAAATLLGLVQELRADRPPEPLALQA